MSHDVMTPGPRASRRAQSGRKGRKLNRTRGQRVRRGILLTLLVLVLAGGGTAWWMYSSLDGNIKGVDIDEALGTDRPEKAKTATGATNLLVLGSDSRAGANGELDGAAVSGARSDTAMVIHIPEGRTGAVAVSIPRDTLVTRPECTKADGTKIPAKERSMFNDAFSAGGAACTVKTVEKMSDVRIDHLVQIDFAGFKDLVDTIGGVTVDLEKPIKDPKTGLDLAVGPNRLDGTDSLKFVRTRYGYGDGSDLGRIGLQQTFMMALLKEIKQQDLLGSPTKAYKVASSATKALTTDKELASLTALADFGRSMQGVNPDTMETVMLPVEYDKTDPNRVVADEPLAGQVWEAIRNDSDIPAAAKKSSTNG